MRLRAILLGPPCIELDAGRYELGGGKLAALLSFVAYQGAPVHRSTLLYLLWPDLPEAQARQNLRQLLQTVKHLPYTAAFVVNETELSWPVATDANEFRRALNQHNWAAASRLYRGDLLAGFNTDHLSEFENWLEGARHELAAQWREAVLRYAGDLTTSGKAPRAAHELERLHQADRLDEVVLRALLEALYASDGWDQAAVVYGAFLRQLTHEVGGEPEGATLRLADRLRGGVGAASDARSARQPTEVSGPPEVGASNEPGWTSAERRRRADPGPERLVGPVERSRARFFRGRQELLERLRQALTDDEVRLIQVGGRGGIGKTSLVTKLLLELQSESVAASQVDAMVYVSLREAGARLPDGVVELLGQTLDTRQADALRSAWASPLPLRSRLEAVFGRVLRHHSTIIVLDNAETLLGADNTIRPEFADLGTLIEVCVETSPSLRIITTSRYPVRFSAEVLGRLGDRQLELTLSEGLLEADAVSLLRDLDADGSQGVRDADDAVLGEVARRCHCVPRILETLVGTLRQRRTWNLARLLAKPGALDEIVANASRELYGTLSAEEKQVVQILAVYDRGVPAHAVQALLLELDASDILDTLADSYVVSYNRDQDRFSLHPLDQAHSYREIVKEGGEALRVELHGRAAAFFATLRKPDEENTVLTDLWPQLQEFDQLLRAGLADEACSLLTHYSDLCLKPWGHAVLVTELHLRLADRVHDKRVWALSLGSLSGAYAELGDLGNALSTGEEALALYQETGWQEKEARLISSLGAMHVQAGALEKGYNYIQRGLALSRQLGDRRGEMIALTNLAAGQELKKNLPDAAGSAEAALALARDLPAPEMEATLLNTLGVIYGEMGKSDKALAYLNEAAAAAEQSGDRPVQGSVQESLGTVYLNCEELKGAEAHFRSALAIATEIGDRWLEATAQKNLGLTLHKLGRSEWGLRTLREALAALRGLGETLGEGAALSTLGSVHHDLGNVESAAALWLVAHDLLAPHGLPAQEEVARHLRRLKRSRKRLEQLLHVLPVRGDELVRSATGQAYGYFGRSGERSPEAFRELWEAL